MDRIFFVIQNKTVLITPYLLQLHHQRLKLFCIPNQTLFVLFLYLFSVSQSSLFAQFLAGSNFGLRSKIGITLNQEYSNVHFERNDENIFLEQHTSNFQASFPLLLQIDTTSSKVKLNILKAEYTFRYTENIFSNNTDGNQTILPENFYANAINLSYLHTISYPWMAIHSITGSYIGDYGNNNPLNINASSFLLYRFSDKLILGAGVIYQNLEDEHGFLVVPYMDWRVSKNWFVSITAPDRILIGRNFGRKKQTQIAWGTYLEFLTRFAFQQNERNFIYQNFNISSGIDFRTLLKGKLYLNAFIGNNFYKNLNIRNNDLDRVESIAAFSGLNIKVGLSLNLQD